jgi:putative PEP-CTERM system histidine kinase
MNFVPAIIVAVSFGLPSVAYLLLTGVLVVSIQRSIPARWLIAATAGTFVWGLACLSIVAFSTVEPSSWLIVLDAGHLALWVMFVGSLLRNSRSSNAMRMPVLFALAALVLLASLLLASFQAASEIALPRLRLSLVLSLPLIGLLGLEQVYRNGSFEQKAFLKLLTIAIGSVFVISIFIYSQALLFESIGLMSWSLRGLGFAVVAPLILLAVKRQPDWGESLYISRHIVFYTTSLTAAGCYLLVMAAGGYVIGASGLTWGPILQAAFLVLSGNILIFMLFSRALRMRFRVFLAKHFYRNRYDYREEWLRLMQTLAGSRGQTSLRERAIQALADIIQSPAGTLWLYTRDGKVLSLYGAWRGELSAASRTVPEPVANFIRETRWVVDSEEYQRDPEKYSNAFGSFDSGIASPAIFIPLVHDDELVGIVRLERPEGLGALGFEDHDLLKTAGQQVAIFLIQERDQEELSETRQFEAFSRLTTFLMHDLKNMISQQELVVGNAKRHKHRPEFIDDAIETMGASVQRMRKLLERLKSTDQAEKSALVDVGKLLYEVASSCADRHPFPRVREMQTGSIRVSIDRDKLAMALTHAIRNAQDATGPAGNIEIDLETRGAWAEIRITDNGCGMRPEFIRDSLFKPFKSTKGAKGMGIGAYQIRETVRTAGGEVVVKSELEKGTTVCLSLPLSGGIPAQAANSIA